MSNSNVKIAILCLPGLQSFLKDIAKHLSRKYEVVTCFEANPQKIAEAVSWADVVWIEWANEIAVALTNKPALLEGKHVICRLHSYEAFVDDFCQKIQWGKVNTLMFVAEHIEKIVESRVHNLEQLVDRIAVIPNGLDIDEFSFRNRKNGHHLAYVGYINYKKGPMLLLHAFRELVQKDDRYKLFIAGKIQDVRYEYYFRQMIDEMNLHDNIRFDGWIEDVDGWLQDKNYIISSSVLESQGLGILEAMACGIKPVIHNFVGARTIYPERYLWNTIPEFVDHVTNEKYDSAQYRQFVQERFSLVGQMRKIDELIADIVPKTNPLTIKTDEDNPDTEQLESEAMVDQQGSGKGQGLHPQIVETLEKCVKPGMNVLELGCKNGQLTRHIAELGASVVGVDTSAAWIDKARVETSHPEVNYQVVDYSLMDLDQKFDLIILIQELEYIPVDKVENFLSTIVGHASDRAIIYVDIRDGRYIRHKKKNQLTGLIKKCESYTPDVVLAMFAKFGYQPYHINIYGEETPVQFNEYLFAAEALFDTTYKNR